MDENTKFTLPAEIHTVADLRAVLDGLPDDTPVTLWHEVYMGYEKAQEDVPLVTIENDEVLIVPRRDHWVLADR